MSGRFITKGNTSLNIYSSAVEMCKKVKWILMFHIDPKSNWSNWKRKSLASWALCNESQSELEKKEKEFSLEDLQWIIWVSPEPSCIRGKHRCLYRTVSEKGLRTTKCSQGLSFPISLWGTEFGRMEGNSIANLEGLGEIAVKK